MIEISVTGLQKSFDLEKKILDGLTFQINSGERVGLLGKNGAGKTTLFRILTGEIDYDAGEVAIASDRRVGLISQIPVYPAGYTVEDVLQSAFERMRRMADEMERLSAQMAKGDESEETLRRYGELSIPVGTLTGSSLLAGRGPSIHVRMQAVGSAKASLRNAFTSAGINQTRHQVLLDVSVTMSILLPGFITDAQVTSEIAVAETVIVGGVPNTYTYFSTTPDEVIDYADEYIMNNG